MKTTDDIQSTNAGNGDTHTSPATPRPADSTSRQPGGTPTLALAAEDDQNGRVARSTAAAWMTLLIAVPVVVAFLTVWGGWPTRAGQTNSAWPPSSSSRSGAYRSSPAGCTSASSACGPAPSGTSTSCTCTVWDGTDRPTSQAPRNSDCYQEWLDDGGERQQKEQNIYRQKFAAYYGRSIPDPANATSDFSVRTENMFPVFLATIVLAVCWVAVLWNTSSATNPEGIWDVLKFAFLGAYAFIVQSLIRRFFQSDLRPSAYASVVLRIIVVLVTMAALHQLLGAVTPATEAAIAFMVGFFPVIAFQALQRAAGHPAGVRAPDDSRLSSTSSTGSTSGMRPAWWRRASRTCRTWPRPTWSTSFSTPGCRWEGWSTGLTRPSSTCTDRRARLPRATARPGDRKASSQRQSQGSHRPAATRGRRSEPGGPDAGR